MESGRHPPATIRDFDNKVSEADAYLQILIDQVKDLEERVENCEDNSPEQQKYQTILDKSNIMLENIKHSIVLLQIAKNTAHPVNGIYNVPTTGGGESIVTNVPGVRSQLPSEDSTVMKQLEQANLVQTGIELGAECLEGGRRANSNPMLTSVASMQLVVPETSYSSSEGEDDFFDANDAPFTPTATQTPTVLRQFSIEDDQHPQIGLIGSNPGSGLSQAGTFSIKHNTFFILIGGNLLWRVYSIQTTKYSSILFDKSPLPQPPECHELLT